MRVMEKAAYWLAPPECLACGEEGASLCSSCAHFGITPFGERCFGCSALSSGSHTCSRCRKLFPLSNVWISSSYEGYAKALVQKFKFEQQRAAVESMASLMTEASPFLLPENIKNSNYIVIPVPTATSRMRERGFDRADLLSRIVANKLRLPYIRALNRLDQHKQIGAGRSVRMTQPANSYYAHKTRRIEGCNILLIDDVVTTGATLGSCARTLRASGAKKVDALIFAKKL